MASSRWVSTTDCPDCCCSRPTCPLSDQLTFASKFLRHCRALRDRSRSKLWGSLLDPATFVLQRHSRCCTLPKLSSSRFQPIQPFTGVCANENLCRESVVSDRGAPARTAFLLTRQGEFGPSGSRS